MSVCLSICWTLIGDCYDRNAKGAVVSGGYGGSLAPDGKVLYLLDGFVLWCGPRF